LCILTVACLTLLVGCKEEHALVVEEVLKVVLEGEAWWNDGSIAGYMDSYWKSPQLRFASGNKITYGWQETLDGYLKRYPDREAMGRLVFSELDVTVFSNDDALVFGKWRLERESDTPHGLFTMVIRRFPEGWRIIHDHTSSAD
jgi:hypothetical protein